MEDGYVSSRHRPSKQGAWERQAYHFVDLDGTAFVYGVKMQMKTVDIQWIWLYDGDNVH